CLRGPIFGSSATICTATLAGFQPANVAVQIVAEEPKIGPRRHELEHHLSEVVGAPVSVLATTTDGLGFLSDSRGVAAVATALVQSRS
ncbi:MAG: 2-C-methyl-D-erythritol 2,4-cyclodiphosphate synthase, partial [Actinobacteria bacterium]|nr:2-C-methyl-D-erythritol 2,4-cyclodiphosphate synthase [Actinomycetota bacterium]